MSEIDIIRCRHVLGIGEIPRTYLDPVRSIWCGLIGYKSNRVHSRYHPIVKSKLLDNALQHAARYITRTIRYRFRLCTPSGLRRVYVMLDTGLLRSFQQENEA